MTIIVKHTEYCMCAYSLHCEGCIHLVIIALVEDGTVFRGDTFCFYSFTAFIVKNKHLLIDLEL